MENTGRFTYSHYTRWNGGHLLENADTDNSFIESSGR